MDLKEMVDSIENANLADKTFLDLTSTTFTLLDELKQGGKEIIIIKLIQIPMYIYILFFALYMYTLI